MGDPEFYKKDRADIVANNERLEELKRLLAEAYGRWEELEQICLDIENSRLSKCKNVEKYRNRKVESAYQCCQCASSL